MKKHRLTIVLLGDVFVSWGGGIDFLRYCANALALVCDENTKLVLLLPDSDNHTVVAKVRAAVSPYVKMVKDMLRGKKIAFHRKNPFTRKQLSDSFSNIDGNLEIVFYPKRTAVVSVLAGMEADVVIPTFTALPPSSPVPWVGYLYDFQHRYHANYFTEHEIQRRNTRMSRMLAEAKAVIVNAADAKQDILTFFPDTGCRVFDLPFSAVPIESWFEPPSAQFAAKYRLPQRYFAICNQFWIHKDHGTAFQAFATYLERTGAADVHLVCTGDTSDPRHPSYFSELKDAVHRLGLTGRVHYLGYISKKDQIDIMKGSLAVLQPTLFEGGPGGGAIYDAVALGIPAVLSDIRVNREIEGYPNLLFFKASDPDDMAEKMIALQGLGWQRPGREELVAAGRERTEKFGLRLLEAVQFVTGK
jgi:glycosyltransferase involved in cell wall biosynthesis